MVEVIVQDDFDVVIQPEPDDDVIVTADDEIGIIQVPEQGPPGPQGIPGLDGEGGNAILYGPSDPTTVVGKDDDFYINTTTHFIFGPKATIWPPGTSLIGPQGAQGLQGPQGAPGTNGTNGNTVLYGTVDPTTEGRNGDFYINTITHFIFGPKGQVTTNVWPAGTSLVGPQGPQGPKGDVGPSGGLATIYISDTPPTGVPDNVLWWESDSGNLFVRYNDGDSSQWVLTGGMGGTGGVGGGTSSFPATATPLMDGTASVGTATTKYALEDHVHPSDTSRAPLASPVFTGDPKAPTPSVGDNDTSIATTAFVQAAITAGATGGIPSGTKMLFAQPSAPVGWTLDTTHNDKALRVINTTGGAASGGTNSWTSVMGQSNTGDHTLQLAEMSAGIASAQVNSIAVYPAGSPSWNMEVSNYGYTAAGPGAMMTDPQYVIGKSLSGSPTITYTNQSSANNNIGVYSSNTSGGAHNHPITMDIQYVNVIIASKN
jgi:hypothetical protein